VKPAAASVPLPKHVWALLGLYGIASLVHFSHNAEYIAFYPNLPAWLTREKVYLAWLVVTGIGAIGAVLVATGSRALAALFFAVYGASGLDGLGHYTLALCSEHTLAMNLTIWFEAAAGVALAGAASCFAWRQVALIQGHRGARAGDP
jgi:hypothetical protein